MRTKLHQKLADHITECVVDAVLAIRKDDESAPDLHMIEIQVNFSILVIIAIDCF